MILDPTLVPEQSEREVGLRALDSYERQSPVESLSAQCLEAMASAIRSVNAHVSIPVAHLLGNLALDHQSARNMIRRLQKEESEDTRFSAICAASCASLISDGFAVEILRIALSDPSMKVRRFAVDEAMRWRVEQLLPDLRRLCGSTKNATEREETQLVTELIAEGYWVKPASDADLAFFNFKVPMHAVYVRTEDGEIIRCFATSKEVDTRGAAQVAQRTLEDYYRQHGNPLGDERT